MNSYFEITDQKKIYQILDDAKYGTLALSVNNIPYATPMNFVRISKNIYFHGALKNKKMQMLKQNQNVSFSVVENYSLIDSNFSNKYGFACPATQFFKSISIDGVIEFVEDRIEKEMMFEALMKKLQPKGGYKNFSDEIYDKALKNTAVFKLIPKAISCKFKFGQHLNKERFEMIILNLEKRNTKIDKKSIKIMKQVRRKKCSTK
jgi:nitroimidazol reductase NimA-like FMN-containing flavoprotein (pyridoxamine 5'-phosphate oxidase superfamily)